MGTMSAESPDMPPVRSTAVIPNVLCAAAAISAALSEPDRRIPQARLPAQLPAATAWSGSRSTNSISVRSPVSMREFIRKTTLFRMTLLVSTV